MTKMPTHPISFVFWLWPSLINSSKVILAEVYMSNICKAHHPICRITAVPVLLPCFDTNLKHSLSSGSLNHSISLWLDLTPRSQVSSYKNYNASYLPKFSRTIHNYVIWRLVMDLMPHLPPQYEATRSEFRRVLLGVLTDR
jgi:hypothetical protein